MKVEFRDYSVDFENAGGGFPTAVTQLLRHGRQGRVIHTDRPWLSVKLADGRIAVPALAEDYTPLYRSDEKGVRYAQYSNVGFRADGSWLDGWKLGLEYEFYPDGNVFIGMSFAVTGRKKPELAGFTVRIPMDLEQENAVTWGFRRRYRFLDPTGIYSPDIFVRNLTEKKDMAFGEVNPLIGFDFGRENRLSRHMELFVEDQRAVDEDPGHADSRLFWENGNPVMVYEFQTAEIVPTVQPYYWRNRIGFTLGQTPKVRDKAPLRLYHYFDETKITPTNDQIRKMAAEGADVLALHECWRTDMQNGGIPYDEKRFFEVVEECHKYGIRVTPYIRGDGESAVDDQCSWFNWYLKKNYDGLYIDYGAVDGFYELGGRYPGGRYPFKRYYNQYCRLREETVGKDGIMTVHTGPFFSAGVLASQVDGYVAGEGECGILLNSRRENAYFNESTIAPGSLWTAAFPAYQTQEALPYMANIGQFPHVTLGEQWKSCCLAHPDEPGNVTFARPLWKLYGLMKDERNILFDNDICDEEIVCDSPETGVSSFRLEDGSRLMIMSNFSGSRRLCSAELAIEAGPGFRCFRMSADSRKCSAEPYDCSGGLSAMMDGFEICGFLVCAENDKWRNRIAGFEKPYPEKDEKDLAYEKKLELAREIKLCDKPVKTAYLKIDVPSYEGTLETAFWFDSYEKIHDLDAIDEKGCRRRLGYISRLGLTVEEPALEDSMWPGEETGWIPLHEILEKGKYIIEIHSSRDGADCNIKYHMLVSETPGEENAREISFFSEIDSDRSRLSFHLNLV